MTVVDVQEVNQIDLAQVLRRSEYCDVPGADKSLYQCFVMSTSTWVGTIDGEIACVWGLIPPSLLAERAYLWLMTTDKIAEHKFTFIRQSQIFVEHMLEAFPEIIGYVEVGNHSAIKWIRWLGATFSEPMGGKIPFKIVKRELM